MQRETRNKQNKLASQSFNFTLKHNRTTEQTHKKISLMRLELMKNLSRTRKTESLFPAIAETLDETDNALETLMIHARALANHVRLFFVLDNVDTVIHAQFRNVLSSVLEELISLDKSVQILTTSRDKRLDCEQLDVESVDLKPLSEGHCAQWLRSANTRGKRLAKN